MSVTTNVVTKRKQAYYNAGANSAVVDTAVEEIDDIVITVRVPFFTSADGNAANGVNDSTTLTLPVATKLAGGKYACTTALANTGTDTVLITVSCNGSAAALVNSDIIDNVAANGTTNFVVTEANAALAADETCHLAFTMEDVANNPVDGVVTLQFRRQ